MNASTDPQDHNVAGQMVSIQFAAINGVMPERIFKACHVLTVTRAASPANYHYFDFKDESGKIIGHAEGPLVIWSIMDPEDVHPE